MRTIRFRAAGRYLEAGAGRPTLVNALVGANTAAQYERGVRALDALEALDAPPDIVSDLSLFHARHAEPLWRKVVGSGVFGAGVLPVYWLGFRAGRLDRRELLDRALEAIEGGASLLTVHPTVDRDMWEMAQTRLVPCTSRGGAMIARDMMARDWQGDNAYVEILGDIARTAAKRDVAISIGASFRSANIFDSLDAVQLREFQKQSEIAQYMAGLGVGVVVEAPGHARPSDICRISSILRDAGFPVMPLGPIPTDYAPDADHVAAAIGAVLMGMQGCAHILAVVTREEHHGGVPRPASILEGVRAARVAAHVIDIHNLGQDCEDLVWAKARAAAKTCIKGAHRGGCSRCGEVCPLVLDERE